METWDNFKCMIKQWSRLEITDQEFYCYLLNSDFDCQADRRLANIFIKQHDGGEWNHPIYHRVS